MHRIATRVVSGIPTRHGCTCFHPSTSILPVQTRLFATKPSTSGLTLDEAIPHSLITIVDPSSKTLLPPAKLSSLLSSLDRDRFSIQLVDGKQEPAVCILRDKKAEWDKAQAKKKAKSMPTSSAQAPVASPTSAAVVAPMGPMKEVKLSWTMAPHDLSHKLAKAGDLIRKSGRVKVVLGNPRGSGGAVAGGAVAQKAKSELVSRVKEMMLEDGACKETRGGSSGPGEVWLFFQRA